MDKINKKKHTILFIYHNLNFSIKTDLLLLKKYFEVINYEYIIKKNAGIDLAQWMTRNANKYKLVYIFWGDIHATIAVFMAKLLRKKSILIAGGYDTTYIPEIDYGFLSTPKRRLYAKIHYSLADLVLVVDGSLKKEIVSQLGIKGDNIETLPTGYDYNKWKFTGVKENTVLTTCQLNKENLKRKGIETFLKCAKSLPEIDFVVVGKIDKNVEETIKKSPSNVKFTGYISNDELVRYYQRSKVYCQLSLYEGLPNTLCEAMLCECVPVGTKICGIPTAIGDTGYYVSYGDSKATMDAIKQALKDNKKGKMARERIKTMFTLEKRENDLAKIVKCLLRK